jgi:NADH-quinone oxidoreductase subunit E
MTVAIKTTENVSFEFSPQNLEKIGEIIAKYPQGKQASAVLPLLDLAQRQNGGWLSRSAIESVGKILAMAPIRVYEVASFYTMFNLNPVGKYLIQVCGTTPCWLRGAGDIMEFCKKRLNLEVGQTTKDLQFTLMEVECLGACVNAPVIQINDDYVEDLSVHSLEAIITDLEQGKEIVKGSKIGRVSSEPFSQEEK